MVAREERGGEDIGRVDSRLPLEWSYAGVGLGPYALLRGRGEAEREREGVVQSIVEGLREGAGVERGTSGVELTHCWRGGTCR